MKLWNVRDDKQIATFDYEPGEQAPTAFSELPDNPGHLMVCFKNYCGVHRIEENIISALRVNTQNVYYFSADHLIGCSHELCFDAQVDAAMADKTQISVFRGLYHFVFNQFSPNISRFEVRKTDRDFKYIKAVQVGAALVRNRQTLIFYDHQVYVGRRTGTKLDERVHDISRIFNGTNITEPDAADFNGKRIRLVFNDSVLTYRYKTSDDVFLSVGQPIKLDKVWPGLQAPIDAMVTLGDRTYFFYQNFYRTYNVSGNEPVQDLRLIQGNLLQCNDDFYINTRILNINTYAEFEQYRRRHGPDPVRPLSPTLPPGTSKNRIVIIVAAVIATICLLLVVAVAGMLMRRRRLSNLKSASMTPKPKPVPQLSNE